MFFIRASVQALVFDDNHQKTRLGADRLCYVCTIGLMGAGSTQWADCSLADGAHGMLLALTARRLVTLVQATWLVHLYALQLYTYIEAGLCLGSGH